MNYVKTKKEMRNKIFSMVSEYSKYVESEKQIIPGKHLIPASGKDIGSEELVSMVDAILDGWLTTGRFNRSFEKSLAKFLNVKHCLTTNSGSSANLIAFNALTSPKLGDRAIKKDDEVITVAAGFPTTVNPIIQFGAIPVFVDVSIDNHNINVDLIEPAINKKTKAIMLAHTLGNPFNLDKVLKICKKYNLWLIEDSCDALGSTYNNKMVGTFGDIGTLSFYPAHHITMGEGGAVFMNDSLLKSIAESYRDWGRDCYCAPGRDNTCGTRFTQQHGGLPYGYDHKYVYGHLGYNLKITDMQAACGLAQLEKVESFINKRIQNFDYLKNKLKVIDGYIDMAQPTQNSKPSWFGFPITTKDNNERLNLINHLTKNKIGTRLLFAGNLIKQPYMKDVNYKISGKLDNTDIVMNNTFWVGIYPMLGQEHLEYMSEKLIEFYK